MGRYGGTTAAWVIAGLCGVAGAGPGDASSPGQVHLEPATLHCVSVRWPVIGDVNTDAAVAVRYRKRGQAAWREGYPLLRTRPNPHPENRSKVHTVPGGWMFAGSIVGLTPATAYEVKLHLTDPDGGDAERTLAATTCAEPAEPPGMAIRHVVPGAGGGTGTAGDPFGGLDAAQAAAGPGTVFLLHKGTYVKGRCKSNTWVITKSGKPDRPIIYRAAGDGEAILDGGGDLETPGRLISANAARHIWLEGLTLQGRQYAIVAHKASDWVIRGCRFRNMTKGFTAHNGGYEESRHHYITDNVFTGPTRWPRTKGIEAYSAVYMSGAGHVVAYNRMEHLGDGIHGTGYGSLSASDWHNNDIWICTDDGLETDHCEFNVRVFHNRIVNVAHGITSQPSRGGPVYIFRNLIYNATYSPFKLHNHTTGVLLLHNTCMKCRNAFNIVPGGETVTNVVTRNNLFLCHTGTGLSVGTPNAKECDFDNDGYGGFSTFAVWNRRHRYKTIADARKDGRVYAAKGAIRIDPKTCFASGLLPPADRDTTYRGEQIDAALAPASDAVDKGVVLPNFNDGFTGRAPDLGCLERGQKPPHYGPRPRPGRPAGR